MVIIALREFVLANFVIMQGYNPPSPVKRYIFQVNYFTENHIFYSRKRDFCNFYEKNTTMEH